MSPTSTPLSLQITRNFKASPARLYGAWTDPRLLAQWWGPDGVETLSLETDVRVGGSFRWELRTSEGEEMECVGQYLELIPGQRIAFSWKWQDDEDWAPVESTVAVHLAPNGTGTEMTFTHTGFPSQQSRENHQGGWGSIMGRLAKVLGEQAD